MTSFTKALYRRDPAAAERFYEQQKFEHLAAFGRNQTGSIPAFGKRIPTGVKACAASCGHPACTNGCTLIGRMD